MTLIPPESQSPPFPFSDQRGGLKTMGILLLALGAFSGCFGVYSPATMLGPRAEGVPGPLLRDVVWTVMKYILSAGLLMTFGAGSIRLERWSRPMIMVLSGTWIVYGVVELLTWFAF